MANPQLEDGYTRVAHEILDEICQFKFNGSQLSIILKIWRMTYGYNRKEHEFAISFLHETTGLSESAVKKELRALIDSNVLTVTKKATRSTSRRISFNKNYKEWLIPRRGDPMVKQLDLFSDQGHDHVPNDNQDQGHDCTPINRYKDLKISIKDKYALFDRFYEVYPRKVSKKKAQESWNRLCKQDDFNPVQAIEYTSNFAETCNLLGTDKKYTPYPATYLNQERWKDYHSIDPEGLADEGDTVSDNMEFLKKQLGGAAGDGKRSELTNGESMRSLPEQCPEP